MLVGNAPCRKGYTPSQPMSDANNTNISQFKTSSLSERTMHGHSLGKPYVAKNPLFCNCVSLEKGSPITEVSTRAQNLWLTSQRSFYSVNIILLRWCFMPSKPYNGNTIQTNTHRETCLFERRNIIPHLAPLKR